MSYSKNFKDNSFEENIQNLKIVTGNSTKHIITRYIFIVSLMVVLGAGLSIATVGSIYKCRINNWLDYNYKTRFWEECNFELNELQSRQRIEALGKQIQAIGVVYENGKLIFSDGKFVEIGNAKQSYFVQDLALNNGKLVISDKIGNQSKGVDIKDIVSAITTSNNDQKATTGTFTFSLTDNQVGYSNGNYLTPTNNYNTIVNYYLPNGNYNTNSNVVKSDSNNVTSQGNTPNNSNTVKNSSITTQSSSNKVSATNSSIASTQNLNLTTVTGGNSYNQPVIPAPTNFQVSTNLSNGNSSNSFGVGFGDKFNINSGNNLNSTMDIGSKTITLSVVDKPIFTGVTVNGDSNLNGNTNANNLNVNGNTNLNNLNISGNTSFGTLPTLPLANGSILVGNSSGNAAAMAAGDIIAGNDIIVTGGIGRLIGGNGTIALNPNVTNNIANLQTGLTLANGNITNLQSGLATTNGNIAQNTSDILNLTSGLATTNNNVTNLQSGLATTNNNVANLQSGLVTTNSNLSTAIGNISNLQNGLTLANGNITNLQSGLATTNSNIAQNTSDITALQGLSHSAVTIGSPANGLSIAPNQVLSLALANGSTAGALSSIDWNTFNNKQKALTVNGNGLFGFTGGNTITGSTCVNVGEILKWNGTAFVCSPDGNSTYLAGTGLNLTGNVFSNYGVLSLANGTGIILGGTAQNPIIINSGVLTSSGTSGQIINTGTAQNPIFSLANTIVANSVGSNTQVPIITFDSTGRITRTALQTITPSASSITNTGNLTANSNKIIVNNGAGSTLVNANIDINEANLSLQNIGGSLSTLQQNAINLSNISGNLSPAQQNAIQIQNLGGNLSAAQQNNINFSNLSGQVDLTSQASGILSIANGGTGVGTIGTAGEILVSNATGYTSNFLGSTNSIIGNGTTSPFQLVNDQITPGNSYYYGTSNTGVKGYFTLASALAGGTTNNLSLAGNTLTSNVNGVVSTSNAISSNLLTSTGNTITNTTNGVAATTSLVNSNTLTNNGTNGFTSVVNGVTTGVQPIVNSNTLTLNGTNQLVSTVNGVATVALDLNPAILAGSTNVLTSTGNVLTSNVNGISQNANLINTVSNTLTGSNLTTTVNGVTGANLNLLPLLTGSTTNLLTSTGNTITNTTNGVAATTNLVNSNTLTNNGTNGFTSVVNGVTTGVQPIVNSNTLTSTGNTITGSVNGINTVGVPIINSNALTLAGTNLISTTNGVASTSLDLTNAINAGITKGNLTTTTTGLTVTGGTSSLLSNASVNYNLASGIAALSFGAQGVLGGTGSSNTFVGADGLLHLLPNSPTTTNTLSWTQAGGITNTTNGVVANTTPNLGTLSNVLGYNTAGNPVYQSIAGILGGSTTNNLSLAGNTLTSNVNGVVSTSNAISSNLLTSTGNTITNTTNGVAATTNLVNSNTLTNNGTNGFTSVVNGVTTGVQPIVNSNTLTLNGTNQLVSTVNGVATVALTLPSGTYTADNGLTMTGTNNQLGGNLIRNTTITNNGFGLTIAGSGLSTSFTSNGNVGIGTATPSSALDVNGAFVTRNLNLANFGGNGSIGAATATVDFYSYLNIPQTTAGITLTIPSPTNTQAGRYLRVNNSGNQTLTVGTSNIPSGTFGDFIWSGTAWNPQNSDFNWSINGNANVDANNNFLGTTNANDVVFRGNSVEGFRMLGGNTFIGSGQPTINSINAGDMVLSGDVFFKNPGPGNTPGAFQWMLTNDNGAMYMRENGGDQSDYTFRMGDNSETDGDRFVFWGQSYLGTANDKWPLVMQGNSSDFYPRYAGNNHITGGLTANSSVLHLNQGSNRVGIKNTNPQFMLHVGNNTVANGAIARFENAGGNCTITPNVAGGVTCTSDVRKKKNITDIDANSTIRDLNNIEIKSYNLNSDGSGTQKQTGFIAQNVEQIFPWLVITDLEGAKAVSYSGFTPLIIKGMQELDKEVKANTEDIEKIKEKLDKLDKKESKNSSNSSSNPTETITSSSTQSSNPSQNSSSSSNNNSNIFNQSVTFLQDIIIKGTVFIQDLVVRGSTIFQGRVSFEDKDMAGIAIIKTNTKEIEVKYTTPYKSTPVVNITSVGHRINGFIKSSDQNGFVVELDNITISDLKFNWIAISVSGIAPTIANNSSSSLSTSSSSSSSNNSSNTSSSVANISQSSSGNIAQSSQNSSELIVSSSSSTGISSSTQNSVVSTVSSAASIAAQSNTPTSSQATSTSNVSTINTSSNISNP